jgi:peptide/nickel transport system ATP-binding protein
MTNCLEIRSLSVVYVGRRRSAQAVTQVDLEVQNNEILGLVGESGCGKTTLAVAVLGLIEPPGKVESGSVKILTHDLSIMDILKVTPRMHRQLLWREIAYIPQGSMSALNPVKRIHDQLTDTLIAHGLKKNEALERARWALQVVSLEPTILDSYPHELSGGMVQRVAIAGAITMQPPVLIADEPTTALDVVTQRSILQELVSIRDKFGSAIMLITHDMGVMAQIADRLAVMYAGCIVEVGPVREIFADPLHPYTKKLINAIPKESGERLIGLGGESPNIWHQPPGCRFHPRCEFAMERCSTQVPALIDQDSTRKVACHLFSMEG